MRAGFPVRGPAEFNPPPGADFGPRPDHFRTPRGPGEIYFFPREIYFFSTFFASSEAAFSSVPPASFLRMPLRVGQLVSATFTTGQRVRRVNVIVLELVGPRRARVLDCNGVVHNGSSSSFRPAERSSAKEVLCRVN